jgi:hypothetical protein
LEKIPEKIWEVLVQTQVASNRDPEKFPVNFNIKPIQIQRVLEKDAEAKPGN